MYLAFVSNIKEKEIEIRILCSTYPSIDKLPQYRDEYIYVRNNKINIIIHNWKLVFCEINNDEYEKIKIYRDKYSDFNEEFSDEDEELHDEYEEFHYYAESISDISTSENANIDLRIFNPKYHSENIRHLFYTYNPIVMKLLIEKSWYNDYIGEGASSRGFTFKIKVIRLLEGILKDIDKFDIDVAINSYKVYYYLSTSGCRPGKDEWAAIFITGKRDYWKDDPYIDSTLKPFDIREMYEYGFAHCEDLISLSEEDKHNLETKCKNIYSENIDKFKESYSIYKHRNYLINEIQKLKKDFIMSYYINYFRKFKKILLPIPDGYDF